MGIGWEYIRYTLGILLRVMVSLCSSINKPLTEAFHKGLREWLVKGSLYVYVYVYAISMV